MRRLWNKSQGAIKLESKKNTDDRDVDINKIWSGRENK